MWEVKKVKWTKDISNLLVNVHHRQKQGKEFTDRNYQNIFVRPTIDKYNKKYNKTKEEKLAFALEKHKHPFLKFIKEKDVSFDNNQAERDLTIACLTFR